MNTSKKRQERQRRKDDSKFNEHMNSNPFAQRIKALDTLLDPPKKKSLPALIGWLAVSLYPTLGMAETEPIPSNREDDEGVASSEKSKRGSKPSISHHYPSVATNKGYTVPPEILGAENRQKLRLGPTVADIHAVMDPKNLTVTGIGTWHTKQKLGVDHTPIKPQQGIA